MLFVMMVSPTTGSNKDNVIKLYEKLVAQKLLHTNVDHRVMQFSQNYSLMSTWQNKMAKENPTDYSDDLVEKIPCSEYFYYPYDDVGNDIRLVFLYGKCSGVCEHATNHYHNVDVKCSLCTEKISIHEKNGGEFNLLGVYATQYTSLLSDNAFINCGNASFDDSICCTEYTKAIKSITVYIQVIKKTINKCRATVKSLCVKQCYALIDAVPFSQAHIANLKIYQQETCP